MGYLVYEVHYKELKLLKKRMNSWLVEAYSENLDWKDLYDMVFSKECSRRICTILSNFHWTDPDTTYKEDIEAFIYAFNDYFENSVRYI